MLIPSSVLETFGQINLTALLVALAIVCLTIWLWAIQHERSGYPAGPFNIPFLGNTLQFLRLRSFPKFCEKYRKRYGNVFTIEFAGHKRVVLSGYDNIYSVLVKNADISSNRSRLLLLTKEEDKKNPTGLIWAPHPHWKTLRSFALNVLRDEGMGKQQVEEPIMQEAEYYCTHFIEPSLGHPMDLSCSFLKATNNVISNMVFGGRTEYDDQEGHDLVNQSANLVSAGLLASVLRNIDVGGVLFGSKSRKMLFKKIESTWKNRLAEHRGKLDVSNPKDIIDEFLVHQAKMQDGDDCFTDGNCIRMANQLYIAGTETVSTTIRWAMLYTCHNPDVMKRVQSEIDQVVGHDRPVKYSDRINMPYTEAVLLEVLRLCNVAPTALPHTLDQQMVIDGKVIPAGADILLNMASVLHDEEVFENPLQFNPDRYLSGDIKLKKQRTIPFSIGRRACLGESLAKMELFLFYVTFLQRYDVKFADGENPSFESPGTSMIIQAPLPYQLIFTRRNH